MSWWYLGPWVALWLVLVLGGSWWLARIIRKRQAARRPFSYQQRDWRNEWKP